MATATILLARHGETDWNAAGRFQGHADRPLNDRGRAQARALADTLADVPLAAVYASDLQRAAETAKIVAEPRGLAVTIRAALREVDVGEFSGMTHAEIRARWPDVEDRVATHGYGWRDGESFTALHTRVKQEIDAIAGAHPGETVLVVGHGAMLRAYLAGRAGLDLLTHRTTIGPIPNGTVMTVEVEVPTPSPTAH